MDLKSTQLTEGLQVRILPGEPNSPSFSISCKLQLFRSFPDCAPLPARASADLIRQIQAGPQTARALRFVSGNGM